MNIILSTKVKRQDGSISLFVLLSCLFFLITVTSVAINVKNKESSINAEIARIKTNYEKYTGNENAIYPEEVEEEEEVTPPPVPKPTHTITFDPNGGTVEEATRTVEEDAQIGTLPTPTRDDFDFVGWFTEEEIEVTANTIMGDADITYYARWNIIIRNDSTTTISEAITNVPTNGEKVEINVQKNMTENIRIENGQNIVLNLNGTTLSTASTGKVNVVNNNGTLEIVNGTITSNAQYGVVDNNGTGTIIIRDTTINSLTKQGVSNKSGGICYIEGNSYITSADAYPIHNRAGGTMTIRGNTRVLGQKYQAICNDGTLTLGEVGNGVNTDYPLIQGPKTGSNTQGITRSGTSGRKYIFL